MQLLTGGSLAERLRDGPLPPPEASCLVRLVAEAVQHAHEHGILHRDLKPANVLLQDDERGTISDERKTSESEFTVHRSAFLAPKLADFGLARQHESGLSVTGAALGTPSYMPPERKPAWPMTRRMRPTTNGAMRTRRHDWPGKPNN
jgi:serine/threonine protein kinase